MLDSDSGIESKIDDLISRDLNRMKVAGWNLIS